MNNPRVDDQFLIKAKINIFLSICRDTPTSAGPNSYGKTKQGFCNSKKVFEKTLKEAALEVSDDKPKQKVKF